MLSEEEKEEMKAMAGQQTIREEFRQLRRASYAENKDSSRVDRLLSFLTAMARLSPVQAERRPFVRYTVVRI